MELDYIKDLYTKYKSRSNSQLSYEQFETFLIFFPSLLVILSDGVIDDEEWVYIRYLAKFMADTSKEEVPEESEREFLMNDYLDNLKYMIDHMERWEKSFIETLKRYIQEEEDIKDYVLDTLYLFAEASEGSSDSEEKRIRELRDELNLDD